jgi:pimeloyl-ACP methyl ester carboxylesterase
MQAEPKGATVDNAGVEPMTETWHSADGHLVHGVEWRGATASGAPTVVLVHGLGGSTVNWELVGPGLANRLSTRVVAVDLAGFGRTPLNARHASIGANGRLLASLIAEFGPVVIVGNSMGGALAVGLTARHPELVHSLVLVDAALPRPMRPPGVRESIDGITNLGGLAAASLPFVGPRLVRNRMRRLGPGGTVDATLRIVCAHPRRVDPALRRHLIELTAYRADGNDSARAYHDAIRSIVKYTTLHMTGDISSIRVPTLMIHGQQDRLVPVSLAHATSRRRRDWALEVFDDCGHVPMIERPDRFVAVTAGWIEQLAHATADTAS